MIDEENYIICPRRGGRLIDHGVTGSNHTKGCYVEQDADWSACELCGFIGDVE